MNKVSTKLILPALLVMIFTFQVSAQNLGEQLNFKDIFHEPFIPGVRPAFSHFSPDGKTVYYRKSDSLASGMELYSIGLSGKNRQKAPERIQRRFQTSPDGSRVLFSRSGDLVLARADFSGERVIVASKDYEYSMSWSPDSDRFAFVKGGDVWISGTNEAYLKQITEKTEAEPGYYIIGWGGDSRLVLGQSDNSDYKEYYFPEYVGTYVKTGASRRGIPSTIISVADINSGSVTEIFQREGWTTSDISATGLFLAIDWLDAPMKKREIITVQLADTSRKVVFRDKTDGWIYGRNMAFAPTGNTLMFQSEKEGWNNIYTAEAGMKGLKQHTFADYDIPWATWISGHEMVLASTQDDPGDVQLMKLDTNTNALSHLTTDEGHRRNFNLSPDRRYVVYSKTFFNEPFELYLLDTRIPKKEIKLTETVPERFYSFDWQKEDYVKVNSRDGETTLSMSVLKPLKRNPAGNPVVVFVHGAGSLQNVYKGWSSSYWREYLFNQYLTTKGYYVIEVDYRHSTGYGRKFREDVTGWMGKYETQDIEDGLAFLADNYDKADTSRVGIYGGSYGGFMALYTVSVSPERFDAAAALRSVTNWENYYYTNPWYTLPRLGTPEENPGNYERSSPISYADSLEKPVLILHGLIDNNVGFQDAAQYIEKLIQSGNEDFEMMMYPSERHSFRDQDSWYDEYRRIFEFFEEELRD